MPKQMTRPTGNLKKRFLENLEACHGIITDACKKTNIARCTFYDYCKKDQEFAGKVSEIRNLSSEFVESKLWKLIEENNITAIIFYLKCQGKDRGWTEKPQIEFKNCDNTLQVTVLRVGEQGVERE